MKIYINTQCSDMGKAKEFLLGKFCGSDYSIEYLPSGKPELVCDGARAGHVSIAHTDGALVMAFADKSVGVDIERSDRRISAKICPSIDEWTKREAYGKWLGVGINKDTLDANLPKELIKTFICGEYTVSVCCEESIEEIVTLIDNISLQ